MTTLQTLAPYLPYGIEVEVGRFNQHPYPADFPARNKRGIMQGINGPVECCRAVLKMHNAGSPGNHTFLYSLEELTPVLRPLSHLCLLLDYKDTPAIEVAKLALWVPDYLDQPTYEWGTADVHLDEDEQGNEFVYVAVHSNWQDQPHVIHIFQDWNVTTDSGHITNQVAIIDYLRSRHFAVGLKAGEFIEKI